MATWRKAGRGREDEETDWWTVRLLVALLTPQRD